MFMNQPTCFSAVRILPALALMALVIAWSCDSYDPDVNPGDKVSLDKAQFYALSNSSTVIDLKTVVKSYSAVDLLIGQQPTQGTLTRLGGGLYAYMPSLQTGRDYFMLDVRRNGQTVQRDTIHIEIGGDTTQLPCGVYAMTDNVWVPTAAAGQVIPIDVLANDRICGVDTADLQVSLFMGPQHGSAVSNGKVVSYTTSGYTGNDTFLYTIKSAGDTAIHAVGLVSLALGTPACVSSVHNDDVQVDIDTLQSSSILVNVTLNDSVCDDGQNVASITQQPAHGSAVFLGTNTIYYTPSSVYAGLYDSLVYQVCREGICKAAVVRFTFGQGTCATVARPDSVSVSAGAQGFGLSLLVWNNDSYCGSIQSLTITTAPKWGTATVEQPGNSILYTPNNKAYALADSLQYTLCGSSGGCSSAWVRINSH
jgi:hypothetical protein